MMIAVVCVVQCQKQYLTFFKFLVVTPLLKENILIGTIIHYVILQHYGIPCAKNWFAHKPVEVICQKEVEVVYDQVIQTSRPIGANKPDIIVKDLASRRTLLIDVSCPNNINVKEKEVEKVAKYQPLRAELRKLWGLECDVVPRLLAGWAWYLKILVGTLQNCLEVLKTTCVRKLLCWAQKESCLMC